MMQPSAADIEDVRLPLVFILSGLILFVLAQGLLLSDLNDLIAGSAQVPYLLSIAHLLVLGFGTMVAMGVMYQLVPVALQTKIYSLRLARFHYAFYVVGVLGIWWSFYQFSSARLCIFASVAVIGILLFEWNLWLSLRGTSGSDIRIAVSSALTNLLITIGLGLWLVTDLYQPHLGAWHSRILAIHILFGTVGWFTLLIIGFSYKLAPMFTLSHGFESRFGILAIYALDTGLAVTAIGILADLLTLKVIGTALLIAGFVCYGVQLKKILSRRMRKKFDPGVAAAFCAMPFTLILLAVLAVQGWLEGTPVSLTAVVYLVVIGWVALTILGYLYKIIPFLWWTYKYGQVIGKQKVPNLKDMMNETRGKSWLILLFAAVCVNTAAVTLQNMWLGWIGQTMFFVISLFYVVELVLVLRK